MSVIDAIVHVHYSIFRINLGVEEIFPPGYDHPIPGFTNDLFVADKGILIVQTGTHTGRVAVTIEVLDSEPNQPLIADSHLEWQEESVYLDGETGEIAISEFSDHYWSGLDMPANIPSWYRIRCMAWNRHEGFLAETIPDVSVDHYRISIWPAPETPSRKTITHNIDPNQASVL